MPLDANFTGTDDGPSDYDPFSKYNGAASAILFPVGERRVGWETRSGGYQRITSHKAIIRLTPTGESVHVLGVVGSGYRLVTNRELFGRVEDTLRKQMQIEQLNGVQVKDRVSGYGRVCFREYIFPNIKCRLGGGTKSDIAFRILVQNGYGGSALRVHSGAIEFYCTNGMISGEYQSAYKKHTSGLAVAGVGDIVANALDTFVGSQERWKHWAKTPVKHQEAMDLFKQLTDSNKLYENLSNQYLREVEERGRNLWAVYSALTFYASHNDGEFKLKSSVEAQDTIATTMLQRELSVARWVDSDAWRKLEHV